MDLCGRMRNKLYLGENVKYPVKYQDISLLKRELTWEEKKDKPGIKEGIKTCSHESYDTCIYKMLDSVMRENTVENCTIPWLPNSYNICTTPNDINTTFWILKARAENSGGDCNLPCHFQSVTVDAKENDQMAQYDPNFAVLSLYYPSTVSKSTEHGEVC